LKLKLIVRVVLLSLALGVGLAADERVMVGDDIFVSADEQLDDVVCVGCSIYVEGQVGNTVAVGGSVTIAEGAFARDVVAIGGSVSMDGEVTGEVVSVGGSLIISGPVERDTVSVFGGTTLQQGAVIGGNVRSVFGGVDSADGVTIDGDVVTVFGGFNRGDDVTVGGDVNQRQEMPEGLRNVAISGVVAVVVVLLVLALVLWPIVSLFSFVILGHERVGVIAGTVNQRAGMCFLVGVGTWFGSIILTVMMSLFFFWLPGGMESLTTLAFFIVAAVGYTGVSFWVGRGMIKGGNGMGAAVLGSVLITFVQAIPVIGWFIAFPIFCCLSPGAAVLSGFGTSTDWLLPRAAHDVIAKPIT
jgi:hypothetical protein